MMKKVCLTVCLGVLAMLITGCAVGPSAPFEPAHAIFFNSTMAPLSTEFNATPVADLKVGEAFTNNILGMFAFGDCSIRKAAINGGLKTVEFADYINFNVLGIYQKTTVVVYGK